MKKPRCGTEPAWELFRSDICIVANLKGVCQGRKNK